MRRYAYHSKSIKNQKQQLNLKKVIWNIIYNLYGFYFWKKDILFRLSIN